MSIATLALKNRPFTLVMFVMLLALGAQAFMNIPRAEDPVIPIPGFAIVAVYPGAAPEDLERLVVDPIEQSLSELEDIKKLNAEIDPGVASIRIEFEAGSNADDKYEAVLRQVNNARRDLPSDVSRVDVVRFSATNVAIVQLALVSVTAPDDALRKRAHDLEDEIEALPGVKGVDVFGAPEPVIKVAVDADRAAALGVGVDEVLGALANDNKAVPAGVSELDGRAFSVSTDGAARRPEDLARAVVRATPTSVVRVSDLATVERSHAAPQHLTRLDGQRAVFLAVMQKEGASLDKTRAAVDGALSAFKASLPADMKLVVGFDQNENVEHRLSGFGRDFGLAILLVLITLLPLGLRASAVVMVSIPLSLAVGLFLLRLAGYSINQLSVVGFVIALGLLVDDSIVVVENISRFQRHGLDRMTAAREATRQITLAVLGCTATLILAFVPLLFLPGTAGAFIRSLPLTVVFTILASLVVSLTIVPLLATFVFPAKQGEHGNFFLQLLTTFLERSYRPLLKRSVRHPFVTIGVAAVLFLGTLALVPRIGFSLFPKAGIPELRVAVELDEGATLADTDAVIRALEQDLMRRPGVRHVMSNVGRDNPVVYYNVTPRRERTNIGELFVQLGTADVDGYALAKDPAFFDALRRSVENVPGARVEVKEFEQGPPLDAPIALRLVGDDLAALEEGARTVQRVMRATPGTRDVLNPAAQKSAEISLEIDRARAALKGVTPLDASRATRLALSGLPAGQLNDDDGEQRDIVVELTGTTPRDRRHAPALEILQHAFVRARSGALVPLSAIVDPTVKTQPGTIRHVMRTRAVTVTAFAATGFNTERVTNAVVDALAKEKLPAGVRLVVAGEVESRKESFDGVGVAAIIALFGVLAVLILEFGGLRGTIVVLSVVPLGVIGGLLALFITGNTLSFTATIGFIALMGIEVKNSILLVDFTDRLRARGVPLDAAIQRAGETRFVPILLTTLTALGGLVPLAVEGSPLTSPLAIVLMGGLITSTILTRVVTPVVYKLLAPEIVPVATPADGADFETE